MTSALLRILHCKLVQVVANGERLLVGAAMDKVAVVEDGGVVVGSDGNIVLVGPATEVEKATEGWAIAEDMDGSGKCVIPGFVDGHSHPVWAGNRCHEFKLKLAGASYLEIHKLNGGIAFTAACTKEAPEEELVSLVLSRLERMVRQGTTTVEAKSGYGFDTETELKELRVLKQANDKHPITVQSTFLGAHSIPPGMDSTQATRQVVDQMLPKVIQERDEGLNHVSNIDVFCEKGVFTADETKEILTAGAAHGLRMNFHGDELNPMQSGELAGTIGAHAVSHCEHLSEEGIKAMAANSTFAVLLPSTAYVLRITPPPARDIINGNVPVALGSDFCPNAHSLSMPFTMNLSCVLMKMTMNEALVASTINSASSLGISDVCGSLEPGKWGDMVLLDAPHWEHVIYEMADPPIQAVFKKGKQVYRKQ